jgi:hypothetical protein
LLARACQLAESVARMLDTCRQAATYPKRPSEVCYELNTYDCMIEDAQIEVLDESNKVCVGCLYVYMYTTFSAINDPSGRSNE